ncbi:MAG: T9SS type A sorting domain-containing protein [Bacteroidales bacterium]|nr:T9SS type A sorting domain-containing protein [Bacteroidales bacterium]
MKNQKSLRTIVLGIFLIFPFWASSQEWVRTFSMNNKSVFAPQIIESYDHGYILGADMTIGYSGLLKIGWIIKLDVNGNVLWDKKLGNGERMWEIQGIDETSDGGLILTGGADTLDYSWYDPWVTKLNACGEVEWCRVFHSNNTLNSGINIKTLQDNSYIYLLNNWGGTFPETSVWLMHLSHTGDIIWEQEYFAYDPLMRSENPKFLEITQDGKYLITGTCDYPDSASVTPWWPQPMLILADSTGEAVWELPWGYARNFCGEGFQSITTVGGAIVTSISNYSRNPSGGYNPALSWTSSSGVPIRFKNLKDSTEFGKASSLTCNSDSVFFVGAGYQLNGTGYLSVFKTDTFGNVLQEKVLNHSEYLPADAIFTDDGKYLVTAADKIAGKYVIKLWKLNSNLDYDSIYTQPLTYDSLCPHAIVSDTLFFQCDLITGMQEPAKNAEKVKMKVYPNPARETVQVQMPQCIQRETSTAHLTITTIFHRWNKDLQFAVYDNFGRLVLQRPVKPDEKEFTLNLASWTRGMYLLRLVYLDTVVATEKLVVK